MGSQPASLRHEGKRYELAVGMTALDGVRKPGGILLCQSRVVVEVDGQVTHTPVKAVDPGSDTNIALRRVVEDFEPTKQAGWYFWI